MLRLSDLAVVGREVRQDDAHDLGRPTQELVCEAVDQGRPEEAKRLALRCVAFTRFRDNQRAITKGLRALVHFPFKYFIHVFCYYPFPKNIEGRTTPN